MIVIQFLLIMFENTNNIMYIVKKNVRKRLTRGSLAWLSSITASASRNQVATSFSHKAGSFTLWGTACSAGLAVRTLLSSRARSWSTMCPFSARSFL